jgi:hypothetical protein
MRKYRHGTLLICLFFLLASASSSARSEPQGQVSLTVSNPYCSQVSTNSPTCLIVFRSIYATSSDPGFLGIQISVNGQARAFFSNFFENTVTINNSMLGNGLQVECGEPNASGVAGYGLVYNVGISATFSNSSATTDTAVVTCPYYQDRLYLPTLRK